MKKVKNIFGKSLEFRPEDALLLLERGISEGILERSSPPGEERANLFGRRLRTFRSADLSALQGLAATGLRGAALLPAASLAGNYAHLKHLTRERLATVVHVLPDETGFRLPLSFHPGFFQLASSNAQEAVDFAILSHHIAERSLLPGLHHLETTPDTQLVDFAAADDLRRFLGRADDQITSPTPAQRLLFGERRRRIPNWFNFDHPTLHGVRKSGLAADLETAAGQPYFYQHLPEIIEKTFAEFEALTGWRYQLVQAHRVEKADYLILSRGPIHADVVRTVDRMQDDKGARVACLRLNLIQPFPAEELAALLRGKKAVTILEPLAGQDRETSLLYGRLRALLGTPGRNIPELYYGQYGATYSPESLETVFRNMMKSGAQRRSFLLDIHFTREQTTAPAHEVLLQTIRREYPGVAAQTLAGTSSPKASPKTGTFPRLDPPLAVRRYLDQGPPFTRLSRFYADTASFFQAADLGEWTAEPFQALPLVPPATANFSGVAAGREQLPVFHPDKCTACGDCFTYCPHAALPPVALDVGALVKGAMQIAAQQGTPVSKLTPMVRNLGKIAGKIIQRKAKNLRTVGDFLPEVFDQLLQQTKPDEEKKAMLEEEISIVVRILSDYPVSVTDVLFSQAEQQQAGSGELFSLAIDPHACTACGLCAEVCPEEALTMGPQTEERLAQLQSTYHLWEQLPDTAGATIARLQQAENYDPLAATLLSRNFYGAMNGGARSEKGAPSKALLHLVAAVAESVLQPRINEQRKAIEKTAGDLARNINKLLTKAMPSTDFDGIAAALRKAETPRLPLDELIGKFGAEERLDLLDAPTLQRKIDLYNDLQELQSTLETGPTGAGRARYGLILATNDAPWAEEFPLNSFTAPVIVQADAGAPERMRGLLEGHSRHLLDNIRLLRRADLEVRNKYRPDQHDEEIASLRWEDLDDKERNLVPPIFLVGAQEQLAGTDYRSLRELLATGFPVKVLLLNDGPAPGKSSALDTGLAYSVMTGRDTFVLQGSLAAARPLFDGLVRGLLSARPSLFQLFTVDDQTPVESGGHWPARIRLAHRARLLPSFRFDPDVEGDFLSTAIDLSGNLMIEADWHAERITVVEEDQEKEIAYSWTPADWLYTRPDWAAHFESFRPETGTAVSVPEYLTLAARARADKIPVIEVTSAAGQREQLAVSPEVIRVCGAALQNWNSLREMAGVRTPYPQRVREETERESKAKYEAELEKMRAAYEDKLQKQEEELMQQVKVRLREKLLALSRRERNPIEE